MSRERRETTVGNRELRKRTADVYEPTVTEEIAGEIGPFLEDARFTFATLRERNPTEE